MHPTVSLVSPEAPRQTRLIPQTIGVTEQRDDSDQVLLKHGESLPGWTIDRRAPSSINVM